MKPSSGLLKRKGLTLEHFLLHSDRVRGSKTNLTGCAICFLKPWQSIRLRSMFKALNEPCIGVLTSQSPNSIFAAVVETYHASLLPSERKELRKFPSKEAMLQSLTDLCWTHKETSRLGRCSAKIAKFSNAFAPYFDIINIFVQVKPEYMGIVWGSLRLIFQVRLPLLSLRVCTLIATCSLVQITSHFWKS